MRGLGELAVVSGLSPVVVDLFGVLTRLGDPWLLLGALALLYAVADRLALDRRRVGLVFAAAFLALGVTLALKAAFALPRPPGAAAEGYGFPSGHALGTTVVWGTAAVVLDVGRRRLWTAVAAAVVLLVAASRVVIGVHYLVDVVVGVGVGLAVVGVALAVGVGRLPRLTRSTRQGVGGVAVERVSHADVDRVFALAAGVGLVALLLRASPDTLLTAGAALGGWSGWRVAEPTVDVDTHRSSVPLSGTAVSVAGLPLVLGGLLTADVIAEAAATPGLLTMGVAGVFVALLFALPRLAVRVVGSV
ncbi:phosphatase PAP2 family protein [Salinigranum salinum]|uniref:phosphatase PAP2 family protein n=1 Tax=Salinigranum salinum TaxID=1364937 RepID=UPI0018655E54|nr:phosphatase PAP2 family protein [Salinigranum salinum]